MHVGCVAVFKLAGRILAGLILLGTILAAHEIVNSTGIPSQSNIQAQTRCETDMLGKMGAGELFSGRSYKVLTEIARAYGRRFRTSISFPEV